MLIHALRAPVFAANTLVVAAHDGGPAVVVDPGGGSAPLVRDVVETRGLDVVAVLLTHAHPDHAWDCAAVAGGVPVLVGAGDAERLADPAAHLGPLGPAFAALVDEPWHPVTAVRPVTGGVVELAPGLTVEALPAPGHTPGSTLWSLGPVDELTGPAFAEAGLDRHEGPVVLTGDVLFAGSVGRTDLPGGDPREMLRTLRSLRESLPPDAVLVPGHGPATTTAHELATNPFLARAQG